MGAVWLSKSTLLALFAACLAVAVASFVVQCRKDRTSSGTANAAWQPDGDRAGTPCTTPGPTLAARIANLDLAGLTVIPITRLPRLKKRVRIWNRTGILYADLTASELVFRRLRVGQATTRSRDVGREPIQVTADGVELDLTGSIGVRAGFYYEDDGERGGSKKGAGRHDDRRGWSCRASGRVHVALTDASTRVTTRLVRRPATPASEELRTGLRCRGIEFSPGTISILSLSGFVSFLRLEGLAHHFRNTYLARAATQRFAAFMVTEVLHGPVCNDSLLDLEHFVEKHVDLEPWSTVTDAERDEVLRRFFHDSLHAGHSGDTVNDGSTAQFTTSTSPVTKSTSLRLHALIYGSLHLHTFALPVAGDGVEVAADGTTQVPVFARRDQTGLRYSLLSNPITNQLTRGPPDVSFGPSTFDKVAFREASIELEPDPMEVLEGDLGLAGTTSRAATDSRLGDPDLDGSVPSSSGAPDRTRSRELVLRVNGLLANLSIGFRIGAELRRAPALVSGMRVLEEKGIATTEIAEAVTELGRGKRKRAQEKRSTISDECTDEDTGGETEGSSGAAGEEGIAIRLPLRWDRPSGRVYLTSRHDDDDDDLVVAQGTTGPLAALSNSNRRQGSRGGPNARGIRLEGTFGTVAPRVRLESRLGKLLGERVVNALLEGVQTHLAALTIPLASHFLADLARQRLQRALDSVSERLATEGGVLWTSAAELKGTVDRGAGRAGREKVD